MVYFNVNAVRKFRLAMLIMPTLADSNTQYITSYNKPPCLTKPVLFFPVSESKTFGIYKGNKIYSVNYNVVNCENLEFIFLCYLFCIYLLHSLDFLSF